MSVLGSQLEIDMDPEGEAAVIPRHVGNTGTGCYKLHDHRITQVTQILGRLLMIFPKKPLLKKSPKKLWIKKWADGPKECWGRWVVD